MLQRRALLGLKGGPGSLDLLGGSRPPRLCFLSFLLSVGGTCLSLSSPLQADGSGKEQVGEADIASVFSEMESFQVRTPSGNLGWQSSDSKVLG